MRAMIVGLLALVATLAGCGSSEDRTPWVLWQRLLMPDAPPGHVIGPWQLRDAYEGRAKCEAAASLHAAEVRARKLAASSKGPDYLWENQCWPPGVTPSK